MLRTLVSLQSRIVRDDEGASLVEYALLVALIAIVAIVAITVVGERVSDNFDSVASEL